MIEYTEEIMKRKMKRDTNQGLKQDKTRTESESMNETISILKPFEEGDKQRGIRFLNNAATYISFLLFGATIVLYQYNRGYSQIYNIPPDAISLSLERYIPICIHLLGLSQYIMFYIAEIKSDKILKHRRYNPIRVLWGTLVGIWLFDYNGINAIIGKVYCGLIALLFALLIELIMYIGFAQQTKNITNSTYRA